MLIRCLIILALTLAQGLDANDSPVMRVRCVREEKKSTVTEHGSGVAIQDRALGLDSKRSVLTAAHVLGDQQGVILIETREDRWVRCTVTKIDKDRDLALLTAPEDLPSTAELSSADTFTVAASKHGEVVRENPATPSIIVAHCSSFGSGMSGGALLASDGKLAGVVTAGLRDSKSGDMRTDVGVFVSIAEVRAFLKGK